jgi:predicted enzyme related to lactoylglutathione lyase
MSASRTEEDCVRVISVIADIPVADIGSAKSFYADYLGLSVEEFNMGWVARYTSPDTGANVQLVTADATAQENPVVSIKVDDVEAALEEAQRRGYEIVHPLTTEPWGIRRFFVRAPDGNVINVAQHRD